MHDFPSSIPSSMLMSMMLAPLSTCVLAMARHSCHNNNNNNNKSISLSPWLQVTLFKGTDTKQIKQIIKMLKVKIYKKSRYKKQ